MPKSQSFGKLKKMLPLKFVKPSSKPMLRLQNFVNHKKSPVLRSQSFVKLNSKRTSRSPNSGNPMPSQKRK